MSATEVAVDEFELFCGRVRRLTGLDLLQYKRAQMERRVRTWIERRSSPGLREYAERIERDRGELEAFLDRVTINVSELWRHPAQWAEIERTVLPDLVRTGGRVRCWSAGSSYGAEAYTLAAVCAGLGVDASILGTDIDKRMVDRARTATFTEADAKQVPPDMLARHFERSGDGVRAREHLRRMVRFEVGDLLRLRPAASSLDLVICRNTTIYFTEEVRDALNERLVHALRPGGYLVIGPTERIYRPADLGLSGTQIYRKD